MAEIGVAWSQLFPTLTLSGSISPSYVSKSSGSLNTWSFGPTLRLPIFEGGRLRANVKASVSLTVEKQLAWKSTVLEAVEQVEKAPTAYNHEARSLNANGGGVLVNQGFRQTIGTARCSREGRGRRGRFHRLTDGRRGHSVAYWYDRYANVVGQLVKQRKLSDEVVDHLERMIRDGVLAEADRLPAERELMRQFGVGRPSIREALLRLSKMGLVEVKSGERARVTRPTPQFVIDALAGPARHMISAPGGVQDFQNARIFFEVGLARNAALHAKAEDLEIFADALEANRQSIGDLKRFERTDVDFHYVLAQMMRNSIFTAIHAALAEWLLEQRHTTLSAGEDQKAYEAHRLIFEAVASRDPDRAERAMREHLEYVARRYTDVVEASR